MDASGPELTRLLDGLAAAADPSRLRLLAVCAQGEWTVSELVQVMGQSQPRISRHLKILAEAGLLDRFREGSWVFYRRAQEGEGARLARSICRQLPMDDGTLVLDRRRLEVVREARRRAAEAWFDHRAQAWDEEHELNAAQSKAIDAALLGLFAGVSTPSLLDIGTGTGRVLQLLASRIGYGLGVDVAQDMLKIARANLDRREARNCQVRHGDMYQLPLPDASFAAVTFHQVLHFADDPFAALSEARRVLAPDGRIIVVDLARHEREELRQDRQHRRLGFSDGEMTNWLSELGLAMEAPVRVPGKDLTVVLWSARLADAQVLPFPSSSRAEALA
ncbi:MAG TPA: metalloregulator ArsR/SmtB family transcription factor [Geminicoccus sp.]|jgi:ArsR family transcriptional regulator|uniref:ArsR/SmtB family transcription factor n=1 Tax=Geminicoccus sp. TaxID=2024832 RepID=UPI002E2FF14D|nr:metalloregulator ArsR/SmtB family transcription factor [Geminicoccus sp.]HEX2525861.1 metalloregulator ArsR/SmtB family transcription factor [Geminicoccus sp.]